MFPATAIGSNGSDWPHGRRRASGRGPAYLRQTPMLMLMLRVIPVRPTSSSRAHQPVGRRCGREPTARHQVRWASAHPDLAGQLMIDAP
jgi:hypothetical protein